MTKKDYVKAAKLIEDMRKEARNRKRAISPHQMLFEENAAVEVENVFVKFFQNDNPRFNENLFRAAAHGAALKGA